MTMKPQDEDYLELWMHFENQATSIKESMFNTVSWIIGFAAALSGIVLGNLINYDSSKATINFVTLTKLISGAGIVLCLYSFLVIINSAHHIERNWERAKKCRQFIPRLENIYTRDISNKDSSENSQNKSSIWNKISNLSKIWYQLSFVILLFLIFFVFILSYVSDMAISILNNCQP